MSLILLQLKIFSENSETSFLILVIPFHLETFFVPFFSLEKIKHLLYRFCQGKLSNIWHPQTFPTVTPLGLYALVY